MKVVDSLSSSCSFSSVCCSSALMLIGIDKINVVREAVVSSINSALLSFARFHFREYWIPSLYGKMVQISFYSDCPG